MTPEQQAKALEAALRTALQPDGYRLAYIEHYNYTLHIRYRITAPGDIPDLCQEIKTTPPVNIEYEVGEVLAWVQRNISN